MISKPVQLFLHAPVSQAIGWALLHFVWQGALIALTTWLTLRFLARSAASVRYIVGTVALTAMIALPGVTAAQHWRAAMSESRVAASSACSMDADPGCPAAGPQSIERSSLPPIQA